MGEENYKDALRYFDQSLSCAPNSLTYYSIGNCLLDMKGLFADRTKEAVAAFKKCIEMDLMSETAVEAGKKLARLGQL